ncbi:hypothetical protein [Gillisia sp. Hel_I_29]|uniref:hypothetical protein n=1 Tax=Gillisia sp. Hel_I_29 TaxID=1249975 RepID=UPI000555761F|nr:hypothetical protein [Gillisia sp. Hel_I_29]
MTVNLRELQKKEAKEKLAKRKLDLKKILEKWEPLILSIKRFEQFYSRYNRKNIQELQALIQNSKDIFNIPNQNFNFFEFSKNVQNSNSIMATEESFYKFKSDVIETAIKNKYFRAIDMAICRDIRSFFRKGNKNTGSLIPLILSFDEYSPINNSEPLKELVHLIKINSSLDIIQIAIDELCFYCVNIYKDHVNLLNKIGLQL